MSWLSSLLTESKYAARSKLGVCHRCMRLSFLGLGFAWAATAVSVLVSPIQVITLVLLIPAVTFSLLSLAHLIAYSVRQATSSTSTEGGCSACGETFDLPERLLRKLSLLANLRASPHPSGLANCKPVTRVVSKLVCEMTAAEIDMSANIETIASTICASRPCNSQRSTCRTTRVRTEQVNCYPVRVSRDICINEVAVMCMQRVTFECACTQISSG